MGFKNSVEFVVGLPIQQCFTILQEIGAKVEKYKFIDSSSQTFTLIWRKGGWGWSQPIRVRADLKPMSNTQTQVCISAEIAAIADLFNFTTRAIDLFEKPFRERITNVSPTQPSAPALQSANHSSSVADEIRKLADLKAAGILSEEEFSKQKARLLEI